MSYSIVALESACKSCKKRADYALTVDGSFEGLYCSSCVGVVTSNLPEERKKYLEDGKLFGTGRTSTVQKVREQLEREEKQREQDRKDKEEKEKQEREEREREEEKRLLEEKAKLNASKPVNPTPSVTKPTVTPSTSSSSPSGQK